MLFLEKSNKKDSVEIISLVVTLSFLNLVDCNETPIPHDGSAVYLDYGRLEIASGNHGVPTRGPKQYGPHHDSTLKHCM
jgi:hypothetical protein